MNINDLISIVKKKLEQNFKIENILIVFRRVCLEYLPLNRICYLFDFKNSLCFLVVIVLSDQTYLLIMPEISLQDLHISFQKC